MPNSILSEKGFHGVINDDLPDFVREFINENAEVVAREVESLARNSAGFHDESGRLRKSIKAYPSKYKEGGWIVGAWSPHAWLVEYGHDLIDWRTGRKIGHVPPHAYLRPALQHGIASAYGKFGVK